LQGHFAIAFSVLISMNYFVRIGAVRLQIATGQAGEITRFVQSNPNSFISAVNLLGWTVFLGMACLFASLSIGRDRIIKYSFLANGIMMLFSSIAYIFDIVVIQAIFMFVGLGVAIIVESVAMCVYFGQSR
jgi:hypothetical protein